MMEDSQLWYDGLPSVLCTIPANYHVFCSWRCVVQQFILHGSKSSRLRTLWNFSCNLNRSQFIDIKGTLSDRGEVTCGVPQGSILGPLLFSIYVNDMESAVDCDLLLYADDSALFDQRGKHH